MQLIRVNTISLEISFRFGCNIQMVTIRALFVVEITRLFKQFLDFRSSLLTVLLLADNYVHRSGQKYAPRGFRHEYQLQKLL